MLLQNTIPKTMNLINYSICYSHSWKFVDESEKLEIIFQYFKEHPDMLIEVLAEFAQFPDELECLLKGTPSPELKNFLLERMNPTMEELFGSEYKRCEEDRYQNYYEELEDYDTYVS